MHPNPAYRQTPHEKNLEFIRERSFGVLAVNGDPSPLISHIPFQFSQDGSYLEAHLVRSNPIVALLEKPREAVFAVSGCDAYVSPDWYGVENQVPTWNYVAAHVRGTLRLLDKAELRGVLDRLSENMENRLLPKTPWTLDKVEPATFKALSLQIVPIAMDVSDIQATWKLSQNKTPDAVAGAAGGIAQA
ncbi:MAG: FMN-binding negative transcriptional regulator, partial [Rhodospirillaceae bacterium]|nr:FMN-binding negative transcriptional regulator [Rhodospirillaceae bacterium]